MALAELYGLLGRVDAAKDLFRRSLARGGVDLQEFPIYFGTDRKRDNDQPASHSAAIAIPEGSRWV